MTEITTINNNSLSIKEYNGLRVVSFTDIDSVHKITKGTAKKNFTRNKNRFIINEDYFSISKSELGDRMTLSYGFGKNAATGILLTESDYLMITKSLVDDKAWDVQRQLVNTYFTVKNIVVKAKEDNFVMENILHTLLVNQQEQRFAQETTNQQMQNFISYNTQILQTICQTLQSQQPQPLYPPRSTTFKTKTFAKLNLLAEHYRQPLSKIIHSTVIELEDTYDISLSDYQAQYIIQTRIPRDEVQILDIIEYNTDISKLFTLTLNNLLDQNEIPYQHTEKRENVFTGVIAS